MTRPDTIHPGPDDHMEPDAPRRSLWGIGILFPILVGVGFVLSAAFLIGVSSW